MATNSHTPLKIIIYYPTASPDPDRHQVEMRSQPLSALRAEITDDDTTASPIPGKILEGNDTDATSPGAIDCMRRPTSSEEDVEREVDGIGKDGSMDDSVIISPIIAPTSFSTPTSPVIQAVDSVTLPRPKGPDSSKKRTRSPDVTEPILSLSSKKVRFLQASEKPCTQQSDDQPTIPSSLSQGDSRFQATHQTFAPRGQCMHQHQAAGSREVCWKGINVGVQGLCVQRFCEGFEKVEAEVPPILIVSIDCVGFKVPFTVLRAGR